MDRLKLGFPGSRPTTFQLSSPVDGQLEEHFLGPVEDASEARETGLDCFEEMATGSQPGKATSTSAANLKDSSPVREYLSRFGKRSWSFDSTPPVGGGGGVSEGASSTHSDAWSLFHELKGKITKTVEERLGDKIDNLNEKLETMKGIRMFQERLEKKSQAAASPAFSRSFDEGDDASVGSASSAPAGAMRTPSPAFSPPRSPHVTIDAGSTSDLSGNGSVMSAPRTPPSNTGNIPQASTGRFTFPSSFQELRQRRKREKELASSATPGSGSLSASASTSVAFSSLLKEDADGELAADAYDVEISSPSGSVPVDLSSRRLYGPPSSHQSARTPPDTKEDTKRPTSLGMVSPPSLREEAGTGSSSDPTPPPSETNLGVRGRLPHGSGGASFFALAAGLLGFVWYFGVATIGFFLGFIACLLLRDFLIPTFFPPAKPSKPSPLPDYANLPPLIITSEDREEATRVGMDFGVPEERPPKVYQGWMLEYPRDAWDVAVNKQKDLIPVYVRLEGTKLVLTGTKTRIPKRVMWNEPPLDPVFTSRREYDISGCPVYLVPFTLSRKRLWNRKYPIVIELRKGERDSPILVAHCCDDPVDEAAKKDQEAVETKEQENDAESAKKRLRGGGAAVSKKKKVANLFHRNKKPEAQKRASQVASPEEEESSKGTTVASPEPTDTSPVFEMIDAGMCSQDHLFLFARADRHKEDWYRRLSAASKGLDLNGAVPSHSSTPLSKWGPETWSNRALSAWIDTLSCYYSPSVRPNRKMIDYEEFMRNIFQSQIVTDVEAEDPGLESNGDDLVGDGQPRASSPGASSDHGGQDASKTPSEPGAETPEFVPIVEGIDNLTGSVFHTLHPTEVASNVRWINCLLSRMLFDFLCDQDFEDMVRYKISSKLRHIRIPGVRQISCVGLDLGSTLPVIHRSSAPLLDERGFWVDFDVSYGGGFRMTVEAKIDLRPELARPREGAQGAEQEEGRSDQPNVDESPGSGSAVGPAPDSVSHATCSDDEYSPTSEDEEGGGSAAIKKFLDRVTTSQYFKHVRELKYVKKGVEALAKTPILLSVEVIQIFGVLTVNIPPPPADRVWWGFRKKPHIVISARPKVGQTAVNVAHLVEPIEAKLLEQVEKFLVLPNMDDIIVPLMTPVTAQFLRAQSCIHVKTDPAKRKKSSVLSAS